MWEGVSQAEAGGRPPFHAPLQGMIHLLWSAMLETEGSNHQAALQPDEGAYQTRQFPYPILGGPGRQTPERYELNAASELIGCVRSATAVICGIIVAPDSPDP